MSAVGVLNVIITVFLANTVDYGEFKNSRRDESVIFSMQTFVVKLASGIAGFISSMVLFVFHISSNKEAVVTEPIAASSRMGLRLSMTIIPIVVLVIGFIVFKKRYILTDRSHQLCVFLVCCIVGQCPESLIIHWLPDKFVKNRIFRKS